MSIAICRIQKLKGASAVAGVQIHNRRERDKSHSNPNIDWNKSQLNYSIDSVDDNPLIAYHDYTNNPKNFNTLADERIKQGYTGKKAIRKDAAKVCETLFTSDTAFFEKLNTGRQYDFFKDCYKWACKRYGVDNIISAIVHMDEATPHLHIDFVPLTADGRLSAKSVLGGRVDLQRLQDDFYENVGKPCGMERGERADLEDPEAPKPRKHIETPELKRRTIAEIEALEAERDKISAENAQKRAEIEKELKHHTEQEAALKRKIEGLERKYNAVLEDYTRQVDELNQKGRAAADEVNGLKRQIQPLNDELAAIKAGLEDSLKKADEIKSGEDIMLDEAAQIEILTKEIEDNLNKFIVPKDEIRESVKALKKIVKKAHKNQDKASALAFTQWEALEKAAKANKRLAEAANRVPGLQNELKTAKTKVGELTAKLDHSDRVIAFDPVLQAQYELTERRMREHIEAERRRLQEQNQSRKRNNSHRL